ncbi:unnamed protein product [Penicillium manginii]
MVLEDAFPEGTGDLRGLTTNPDPQFTENPALLHNLQLRLRPELIVKPDPLTMYLGFWGTTMWKINVAAALVNDVESWWTRSGRFPTQDEFDVFTAGTSRGLYNKELAFPIAYFANSSYLFWAARRSPYYPKKPTPTSLLAGLKRFRIADPPGFREMLVQKSFMMLFILFSSGLVTRTFGAFRYASDMQDPPTPEDIQRRRVALANDHRRLHQNRDPGFTGQILQQMGFNVRAAQVEEQGQSQYDGASSSAASSESELVYGTSQNGQDVSAPQPSYGSLQNSGNGSSQPDSKLDFFGSSDEDDASPTAPEYRNTSMTGVSTGSAWDRIRQQNSTQGSRPVAPRQWGQSQAQSGTESTNDSLPIDQDRYDYDRRREKDAAQADFNKMMDAERNASSEGPSRGRNW